MEIKFVAPLPSRLGATRTGGIDLNKPRIRAALAAALALAACRTASPSPSTPTRSPP